MKTFLERKNYFFLICLNIAIYYFAPDWCFYISLILTCYFIYLFRNPGSLYKDNFKNPQNIFLSPIYGQVKQIRYNVTHAFWGKELIEVHLVSPRLGPMGLYLPTNCEVVEVSKNKKGHFWRTFGETDVRKEIFLPNQESEVLSGILIRLKGIQGDLFGIQVVKNIGNFWPHIWLRPGDKGRPGACFGHFPFGGSILLYLPKNTEILTKKEADLIAGETTVAAKLS